jgi:hypothetical protein
MQRFADLHTHSTASDGGCCPAEIVRLARRAGLAAVALTDHDTVGGIEEARREALKCPQLSFVAGIEVSASWSRGSMHILGLGIDDKAESIVDLSSRLRRARAQRNPQVLDRLAELGMPLTMEDVRGVLPQRTADLGLEVISRMHIAEAMRRKGYVSSTRQAFSRWIGAGGPAYLDKERLAFAEVISAIQQAHGLAVLAHPVQLGLSNRAQLEKLVRELVDAGLGGIEVYHSDHSDAMTRIYLDLARKLDLAVTGGSDFHGSSKPEVRLGRPGVPTHLLSPALKPDTSA